MSIPGLFERRRVWQRLPVLPLSRRMQTFFYREA